LFVEKRILDYDGCATLNGKKFVTLAGGCAPEASTLPPVTWFYFTRRVLQKVKLAPAYRCLLYDFVIFLF
jgi:hypothetical protein